MVLGCRERSLCPQIAVSDMTGTKKGIICILIILFIGLILWNIQQKKDSYIPKENASSDGFFIENYDSSLRPHIYHYHAHPKRITALWQNSIETLLMLGAGDRIAVAGGLSSTEVLAPENKALYEKIPIRTRQVPDVETLLLLQPDFIVGWLFDFTGKSNGIGRSDFWEKRGVNVYMTSMNGADFKAVHTLEDELQFIHDLGIIVNREDRALALIQTIRDETIVQHMDIPPRVLVIASASRQLTIYTPRTLPGDLLCRLGAEVLGTEQERVGENEFISYEQLLMMNPDIIFIQSNAPKDERPRELLRRNPALRSLRAVQEDRIYCIPFYLLRCPGVRVLDTIHCLKQGLNGSPDIGKQS